MNALIDSYGRVIRDLRVSITPRCNYKCLYCNPLGLGHGDPLGTVSVSDVAHVVEAAHALGLASVRFTGGEPLLRKELPEMIRHAKQLGVPDVSLTTNASLLRRRLPELLDAGLDRVNISIDALDPDVFRKATKGGDVKQVWEGIEAALAADLHPVKINAVVMRGVNESELVALAELTRDLPIHTRYIEYMHLNNAERESYYAHFMPGEEVRAQLEAALGGLEPVPTDPSAPARLFRVPGWRGAVGFINPVSEPFCGACSRMRLTSDGRLRPCLMTDREIDINAALRHPEPVAAITEMFLVAAHRKVKSGMTGYTLRPRTMVAIGG